VRPCATCAYARGPVSVPTRVAIHLAKAGPALEGKKTVSSINEPFLVNLLVIGVGWLLRRFLLGEAEGAALVRLTLNVTLPALIVSTFSTVEFEPALVLLPVIAIGYGLFMALLGTRFLFRGLPRRERGEAAFLLPSFNVGLFAYPLVEGALGRGSLKYLAMFDMGVAVSSFVVVFAIGRHFAQVPGAGLNVKHTLREMAKSVPLVVYMLTLLVSALGLHYPAPVVLVARVLAPANMPLALLALGMYLRFDHAGRLYDLARILGVRYLVGLAAGVALYLLLPFDPLFRTVLLAGLLLPPPVVSLAYAVEFGYDATFVGLVLNVSNVASYFLLWGVFAAAAR
jgi:malate permease and related proteins